MINAKNFLEILKKNHLNYLSGVPDSTFKELITEIHLDKEVTNRIAANECEAISLSSGYHLSTRKIGITYLQNSGLGKTVNPLTSLLSKEVYSIPTILFIGYRGKPGEKDEPQHKMMGRLTFPLLDTLEIPYEILPDEIHKAEELVLKMRKLAQETSYAVAIIIEKGTFEKVEKENVGGERNFELTREQAIKEVVDRIPENSIIVSTTGKTSRELFEYRIYKNQKPRDFLTVGSMGCSSSIATEIAMQKPSKEIFCFDGDGAAIMQMGAFTTIGSLGPNNFRHIIFDNNSHDSTGGQKTNSNNVDFEKVALASGYKYAVTVINKEKLKEELDKIKFLSGPILIVIKVRKGARKDLGRPTTTPIQNKDSFMESLE